MKRKQKLAAKRDPLAVSVSAYAVLVDRERGQVYEQARRYNLPISAPDVHLGRVLRRFHEILAEIAPLYQEEGEDGNLLAQRLRAEIRVKRADAEKKERENASARGEIVTVAERDALLVEHVGIVVAEMEKAAVAARIHKGDAVADQIEAICASIRTAVADRFGAAPR